MTPGHRLLAILLLALCFPLVAEKPSDWHESDAIASILTARGDEAGLPRGLAHCVAYTESRFKPDARSKLVNNYRSCGIMQIYRKYIVALVKKYSSHPESFRWDDPSDNAEVGCKYLAYLIERFGGSVYLGLVAYRWGETNLANIKQGSDIPQYAIDYADSILKMLDEWDETW